MTCLKHNIGHTKPFSCFNLILGGNGRDFPGPLKDPGKSLSVAAPLRIEGLRCLVTKHTMAGALRIARRLPCKRDLRPMEVKH